MTKEDWTGLLSRKKWLLYLYIAAPGVCGIVLAVALFGLLPDLIAYLIALILAGPFSYLACQRCFVSYVHGALDSGRVGHFSS